MKEDFHVRRDLSILKSHGRILFSCKKKAVLSIMTTWMDLEGIMLSEISQTQKDKYLSSHMWNVKGTNSNINEFIGDT